MNSVVRTWVLYSQNEFCRLLFCQNEFCGVKMCAVVSILDSNHECADLRRILERTIFWKNPSFNFPCFWERMDLESVNSRTECWENWARRGLLRILVWGQLPFLCTLSEKSGFVLGSKWGGASYYIVRSIFQRFGNQSVPMQIDSHKMLRHSIPVWFTTCVCLEIYPDVRKELYWIVGSLLRNIGLQMRTFAPCVETFDSD